MVRRGRVAVAVTAVAGLLAVAAGLHRGRDHAYPELAGSAPASVLLRSPRAVERLALSFDALVADVYWIRAVQYFGGTRLSAASNKSYDLLYPLLDIATTLDPRFNIAYRFGAIFLSEGYPNGPGQPVQAIRLLEKGFAANPSKWQYLHDIGFVHYWWLNDYRAAADSFERASLVPGAAEWLGPLAAVTRTRGGDRRGARLLWQQMLETAEHDYLRKVARHRLSQLDAIDQLDGLNDLIARYVSRTATRPTDWTPLIRDGWLRGVPVDPDGIPYVIDGTTGLATISGRSPYFPLPIDPDAGRAVTGERP